MTICTTCKKEFVGYGAECGACRERGKSKSSYTQKQINSRKWPCSFPGCTEETFITPWIYKIHTIPELTTEGRAYCNKHYEIMCNRENKIILKEERKK
jgi:hypothetical protein